ncbi:restriction endonuclease [Idiomarina fontislapidosi]|uniref:Restriction endonuclease type IV Mrr domain-containing protein n=1 Tax=Idiomarina fontislapidosi TaxID=263723 RepID=A0A432Y9B7_9GAMM|nr:restriction endonuclease [Idiomarina fontislapidosi]PYE34462.1 restriction endonuclease [Idiomarina fontislapidosi]RUO57579.1 hypothetical protein CWE25_03695 [Idiomarina fontislapidosi]
MTNTTLNWERFFTVRLSKWAWCVGLLLAPLIYSGSKIYQNHYKSNYFGVERHDLVTFVSHVEYELYHVIIPITKYAVPALLILLSLLHLLLVVSQKQHAQLPREPKKYSRIENINGSILERVVGDYFREQGFTVKPWQANFDSVCDLVVEKNGAQYLVTYDYWRTDSINFANVLDLFVEVLSNNMSGAYIVTSSQFTEAANAFLSTKPIDIISGTSLRSFLRSSKKYRGNLRNRNAG